MVTSLRCLTALALGGSRRLLGVGLLLSAIGCGQGGEALAGPGLPGGLPEAPGVTGGIEILNNRGFVVGYAGHRGAPAWVVYQARPIGERQHLDRPRFETDPRVRRTVEYRDFTDTGFDRGHMAPNYLISNLHGPEAQRQSFLMTNIVLQRPRLNQLVWQRLEEIEADHLARRWDELNVAVGPVFDADRAWTDSGVDMPDAFYRIWLDRTADGLRALALIVPQDVRGDERLDRFVTSVDEIESRTGLDFFPGLPAAVEKELEASAADPENWGFASLACFPARYANNWQGKNGIRLEFDRCDD
ncbi:MAG: DNA/RNA non-specific endonuclease [Salinisphaeraceae bacterium]